MVPQGMREVFWCMSERDTIIITGGAGFIGANFVRFMLAHSDASLVIVDKLTYAGHLENIQDLFSLQRVQFVEADIADKTRINRLFQDVKPSMVINFAAESHVDRSIDDPRPFVDTNIVGTFVLLETARHYLESVSSEARSHFRFLHVSTDEVYGSLGASGRFSEDTPYAPNSPYAASKAGADHLVRAYFHTYGVPTITTNCSNNYGPYQFPEKLIPLVLLNALEGKPLPIYGKGENIRDWLYVEDHCEGLLLVLRKGCPGEKYNLGGTNERTNLQTVQTICESLERCCPAARNPTMSRQGRTEYQQLITFVPDRPGHDRRYAIDPSKMTRELGWRPQHDFEGGVTLTVQWYVEHQDWCQAVLDKNYARERLGLSGSA